MFSPAQLSRALGPLRAPQFIRLLSSGAGVRVRFAPSPTGYLHLGGFRTALVNYLFALKHKGKFILRIEDTDQTRLVPGAVQRLEEDLKWLGIEAHEGPSSSDQSHGPYVQSKRLPLYEEGVERLISTGHAYECFCSETRLDLIRREAMRQRQTPRYDNKCRDLTREQVKAKKAAGNKFTVRFKMQPEVVTLADLVHGEVEFDLTDRNYEGDPIIIKSDGFPTYHFANVVDDHRMEISHVLRGVEWQVSTPKHLQMYRAFGWKPPQFAHLPNVVNKDGTKLSKRQGDVSIKHYQEQTYFPRSLSNFVTKSGGGFADHSLDNVYSLEELADQFEISKVNTAACRLDFDFLSKLNQVELSHKLQDNFDVVLQMLSEQLSSSGIKQTDKSYLEKVLRWCPQRVTSIKELTSPELSYLWTTPNLESAAKLSHSPILMSQFGDDLKDFLKTSHEASSVTSYIKEYAGKHNMKFKLLMKDLRLSLCGTEKGPPIADLIELFGPEEAIARLRQQAASEKSDPNSFKSYESRL